LKALVDEGSFRKGIGNITSMRDGLADLIKTGLGILGVTMGLKEMVKAASEQGQMLLTAKYIGMTADALEAWNGVMAEAGGNADSLINSLGALNAAFIEMKSQGMAPSNQLFQDIAQLGLSPQKLMGENSDQRAKDMLEAASKLKNQGMANEIIKRNLGGTTGGLQAMLFAETTGTSIEAMYARAQGRGGFNRNRVGGLEGAADLRDVADEFKNIFGAFSSTVLKDLKPSLENFLSWMKENKDTIRDLITGMADLTKVLAEFVGKSVSAYVSAQKDPDYAQYAGHPVARGVSKMGETWLEKLWPRAKELRENWERNQAMNAAIAQGHFSITLENASEQRLRIAKVVAEGSAGLLYQTNLMNQLK
jgi:hypothetical protein